MKVSEMKEFLRPIVDRELEEEYNYQLNGGEEDKQYLAKLIACKQWLIKGTSMPLIENMIIKDDIDKYLRGE
jgi:hypothetical protein